MSDTTGSDEGKLDRRRRAGTHLLLIGSGMPGVAWALGVGVAGVVGALAVKLLIQTIVGHDVAYIPLFVAVAVASLAGGFGAGLLTAILGAAVDVAFFQASSGALFDQDPEAFARFVLFLPASGFIAFLVSATRVERERARMSADRFSGLLEDSPDFIIIVDARTWQVEFANAACEAFGWQPDQLRGMNADEVIPELRDADVRVGGPATGRAMTVLSATGESRPVEVLARLMDQEETGRRLFVSARDMSDRIDAAARLLDLARTERARAAELQAVIDSIDAGVAVFALGGEVTLVNGVMGQLIGAPVTTEAELARQLGMSPETLDGLGRGDVFEIHMTAPDRWLEARRFAVRASDDDPTAGESRVLVIRNTTVERATRATRDAFLGILSHELRTPVTTILGISAILGRPGGVPEAQRLELTQDVLAEAERLHRLVEDLLVLSRTEGDRLEFEAEPILIQRAIPPVVVVESRRMPDTRFVADISPSMSPVAADATYVEQILRNLIGNAAKYGSGDGGEIRIEASEIDDEIVVRILDRGPGFDPGDADHLFDIFFRATRTAHSQTGAGIGLFVTKSLVEMMDGRVWAQPRPGGGSEFGFALPVMAPDLEGDEVADGRVAGR
jgi:PAS domain S-box-containing protein